MAGGAAGAAGSVDAAAEAVVHTAPDVVAPPPPHIAHTAAGAEAAGVAVGVAGVAEHAKKLLDIS